MGARPISTPRREDRPAARLPNVVPTPSSMAVALLNAKSFEAERQRAAELAIVNGVQAGLAAQLEMQAIYDLGVKPDWWKLPGPVDGLVWDAYERAIESNDRFCRGVLLLGLDARVGWRRFDRGCRRTGFGREIQIHPFVGGRAGLLAAL